MDVHSMYTRATHDLSRSNMWLIQLSMLLVIVYMLMLIDHDFIETNHFFPYKRKLFKQFKTIKCVEFDFVGQCFITL